ncbi:MAG: magnesium transporter MgtE N-terminal domain-containing protein, partial [Planctomycetota bacterium JB042]
MTDSHQLLRLIARLVADDPVRAAHHIEGMDPHRALEVLGAMPPVTLGKVMRHLEPSFTSSLVLHGTPHEVVPILEKGGSDVCSSVLLALPGAAREQFLASVSDDTRAQIQEILT